MKRSEKEHLKEDPFKIFIANAIETIKESKRIVITGVIILAVLITIILVFLHFKSEAQIKANINFQEIVKIMDSKKTADEKINELKKIESNSGINGISKLNIASLYFMKQEYKKAEETLASFSSSIDILDEKKTILQSEIFEAQDKKEEALALLSKLIKKDIMETPKDSVLLKIAKLQKVLNKKEEAIKTLKGLIKDFPKSFAVNKYAGQYGMPIDGAGEANDLLKELEGNKVLTPKKK